MRNEDLASLELDELVNLFAQSAIDLFLLKEIEEFENDEDSERVNQQIRYGWTVENELKRRGNMAILRLLSLYEHTNVQVRLNAATATLAVAPTEARLMIEAIAEWQMNPQSGEAGMRIWALDAGIFKPT